VNKGSERLESRTWPEIEPHRGNTIQLICAGSSLLLSYTRDLCPCFKKSSDVHFFDFSAFLCKRSEEVLEVVSAEESHLLYLKEYVHQRTS
jgi:hypothetical protein